MDYDKNVRKQHIIRQVSHLIVSICSDLKNAGFYSIQESIPRIWWNFGPVISGCLIAVKLKVPNPLILLEMPHFHVKDVRIARSRCR